MSKFENLKSQAELPLWLEPLTQKISEPIRSDLQAQTKALEEIHRQLRDLVEIQVNFLETIHRNSGR